jgi:hypothetical protein
MKETVKWLSFILLISATLSSFDNSAGAQVQLGTEQETIAAQPPSGDAFTTDSNKEISTQKDYFDAWIAEHGETNGDAWSDTTVPAYHGGGCPEGPGNCPDTRILEHHGGGCPEGPGNCPDTSTVNSFIEKTQ